MTEQKDIDKRRLRESFFRAYDEGRAGDLLGKLASGRSVSGLSLVGEGMHFRCWREKKAGSAMELVFKVANREFLSEIGNLEAWRISLARLPIDTVLLPPVAVLPFRVGGDDSIGLAMPYGPDDETKCSEWWQPLAGQLNTFKEGARRSGLVLGDIAQVRCWKGIPFLIDISDLRTF